MTRRSPKPLNKKLRSLYSWHRWLGVLSAVFVIWLSVTGIILEHSHQLGLGNQSIANPWLLQRFGIEIRAPETALKHDEHWLSYIDGRLYLNQQMVDRGSAPVGISRLGLIWAVASREALWLLNDQGEVLEKIEGLDLPARIVAIGKADNGLVIQTDRGNFIADPLSSNWPKWDVSEAATNPAYTTAPLPSSVQNQLIAQAQKHALNWERILIEAHSGRILGEYGVWLMDAMAVIFIILGVTGLSLWLRYQRAARKRKTKFKSH